MTKRQRRLVLERLFAGVLCASYIALDGAIFGRWSWPIWIALGTLVCLLSYDRRRPTLETASERINRIANTYPFIKLWLATCGMVIAATVVLTTHFSVHLEQVFGFRIVLIALLVLLGPIIGVSQHELYVEYGQDNHRIRKRHE